MSAIEFQDVIYKKLIRFSSNTTQLSGTGKW